MPPTNVRRDLVPPTVPQAHIVQLLVKFTVQPYDCKYTGPKHVVVYPNVLFCIKIYSCVLTIYVIHIFRLYNQSLIFVIDMYIRLQFEVKVCSRVNL